MKKWTTPQAAVEMFFQNEYITACWGVACSVNAANQYEESIDNYDPIHLNHGSAHCGNISNQVIYDDNNDGTADRMVEVGTDGLGNLTCVIYTDTNYTEQKAVSEVKVGDYIYWTTSAGTGYSTRTWHHQGTVTANDPSHPNRS